MLPLTLKWPWEDPTGDPDWFTTCSSKLLNDPPVKPLKIFQLRSADQKRLSKSTNEPRTTLKTAFECTLSAPLPLTGPTEVGLGDDVTIRIEPSEGALSIRVLSGLDSGSMALVGPGTLALPGAAAHVRFEGGFGVLSGQAGVTVQLDAQRCMAPVDLLREDVLSVDGVRVEVVA